jgi:hypothetical protein
MAVEALGVGAQRAVGALAERDVQHAVRREHQARAEMLVTVVRGFGAKHDDDPGQRVARPVEDAARDARALAAGARLDVAPVDQSIGCERWRQRDVEQPALAARVDARQTAQRRFQAAVRAHDAQSPGLLTDEEVAAGQRFHRPGLLETARHDDHVEAHR